MARPSGAEPAPDIVTMMEAEGFPALLKAGRWAMTGIETAISLFLMIWYQNRPLGAWMAMGLLLAYNLTALWIVHRLPLKHLPIRLTLALDLLFLAHVSYWTGGIDSPFLGQCYLIVFVASLFYGARGGLAAGLGAAAFSVAFGFAQPTSDNWEIVRDTAPYFVITGSFTGFLVDRGKGWFVRYQAEVEQALERARDEELRRRELELARAVQRSSLPTATPAIDGLELTVRSEPSREVGGDFHVLTSDPLGTRLGLAVGDVAGKGMAAALVATSIGYTLPHLNPLHAPHAALLRLNDDLTRRLPDGSFVTLLYAEADPAGATLTLWNAGHPPALLWRARGGAVLPSPCGEAPPLGMFASWSAPARRFDFFAGDLLLVYSDGLLEVRSESGEFFGEARLREVLERCAPRGVDAVADGVLSAVRAFGSPTDDLTVVVCQRTVGYPGF